MGIAIKDPLANFTYTLLRALPQQNNLVGLWEFNRPLLGADKNLITGVNATVVGTPSKTGEYTTVSAKDGYITDITASSISRTYISLCRFVPNTSSSMIYVGEADYNPAVTDGKTGKGVVLNLSGYFAGGAVGGTLARTNTAQTVGINEFVIIVAVFSNTGTKLYVSNGDTIDYGTGGGVATSTKPLRFGAFDTVGSERSFLGGQLNMYLGAAYNVALDDATIRGIIDNYSTKLQSFNA